ncbi:putative ABC-type amino acid transport/signal transduction systems, periplasmic component/domain [Desulfamplus magnetovallimortis]|uniref:Putative ABC-type amino acid transport/signal transduction systems, periplasmic component/domain n=1 Tax=Desulfamplus magnetovallimortis TaxID=1246637 RepID=A0A1W1HHK9_9BACT|nr:transporter substrate-binding domain-containing protein [Desulfamplus magnetovallimortis]SLM31964.1 putative ABC-type amino acid transport/signal transduction systems, periplasmic component/domain [Desulfamplus magnetovallimortis]
MKKLPLIFLSMLILIFITSNISANETVRLAIGDWAPYTSETDPDGKLLEEVVTEAFKAEGIDVEYAYYPWKRSYVNVEKGKYDGTFPWNKTEERENEFYFHKESLIKDPGVYFHLKSKDFDWNTIEDLKKYKVGVTIGYKQEETYKEHGIVADTVPDEQMNFKKMLVGRIDVYQTSKVVGYATINKLFPPEEAKLFTNHPKAVEESEYYILFSKKTPNGQHFADKFDSGLKKIKESGLYDKILVKYLGESH